MRIVLLLIGFIIFNNANGQILAKHKWKHRIVVIVSQTEESEAFQTQIKELNQLGDELADRKIVIYQVLPTQYKISNYQDNTHHDWISSTALFDKFNNESKVFKAILIGLDGDVKIETSEIITASELFSTIDSMPMRQTELRDQ